LPAETTPPPNADPVTLFLADWARGVDVRCSYQTDIQTSDGDLEQRLSLVHAGALTMTLRHRAISSRGPDSSTLIGLLEQLAGSRVLLPLVSDHATLTADAAGGATVLNVRSTDARRYGPGVPIIIAKRSTVDRTRWIWERRTVAAVTTTTITIDALTQSWPAGSRVFPAFRAEVLLNSSVSLHTRIHATAEISATEIAGPDQLPSLCAPGTTPPGFAEFAGHPIMHLAYDWASDVAVSIKRAGSLAKIGLGQSPDIRGPRGRFAPSLDFTSLRRSQARQILALFDSRAGRTYPFWLPRPNDDFRVASIAGSTIVCVAGFPTLASAQDRVGRHLALVRRDGSVTVHRVTAAADVAGSVQLAVTPPPSGTIDTVRRGAWCDLVRFDADDMDSSWVTDETHRATLPIISLHTSGDAEAKPTSPEISDPRSDSDPLDGWSPDADCVNSSGVTVPMYEVPCACLDDQRPVFRGADLLMPKRMRLDFAPGQFAKDATHSHAGALTSLIDKLEGKWVLEYDPTWTNGRANSRHWHHITAAPNGVSFPSPPPYWLWRLGNGTDPVNVSRKVWRALDTYEGDDGQPHNIEVRLVAEWETSAFTGAYGALFHLYVFSDEINPSFVDGTAVSGVNFYRDDPAVWASAKRAHPQLALIGHVPTTFQSPCGAKWAHPGETGEAVPPGAPWSSGLADDAIDNAVFGRSGYQRGCMTLGGSCRGGKFIPLITLENAGAGTGLTALRPTNAGWNVSAGGIVYSPPASVTMRVCTPPQTPLNCCSGHPDSPTKGSLSCFGLVTGSHVPVFSACVSTSSQIRLTLRAAISRTSYSYNDAGVLVDRADFVVGVVDRLHILTPWEVNYDATGDQSDRSIVWRTVIPSLTDPDATAEVRAQLKPAGWSLTLTEDAEGPGDTVCAGCVGCPGSSACTVTYSFPDWPVAIFPSVAMPCSRAIWANTRKGIRIVVANNDCPSSGGCNDETIKQVAVNFRI